MRINEVSGSSSGSVLTNSENEGKSSYAERISLVFRSVICGIALKAPVLKQFDIKVISNLFKDAKNFLFRIFASVFYNNKELTTKVEQAVSEGNLERLELLFQLKNKIDLEQLKTSLLSAAEKGHKEVVEKLFNKGVKIDDEGLKTAILTAIEHNDQGVVEVLLKGSEKNPADTNLFLFSLIEEAADNNHVSVIKILVSNLLANEERYIIDEELKLKSIFLKASQNNKFEVIEGILELESVVEVVFDLLIEALSKAFENNSNKVIEVILKKLQLKDPEHLKTAILTAIENDKQGIVKVLLKGSEKNPTDTNLFLFPLIEEAADNNHVSAIKILVSNLLADEDNIMIDDDFNLKSIFIKASQNNKFEVIEGILEIKTFDSDILQEAFLQAVEKDSDKVIEVLLKNNKLSENTLDQAFIQAIDKDCLKVIQVFLNKIDCHPRFASNIKETAMKGLHERLQKLLSYVKDLNEEDLIDAIKLADRSNLDQVVSLLLANSKKNTQDLKRIVGTVVIYAARRRDMDLIKCLLSIEKISAEDQQKALDIAAKASNTEFMETLASEFGLKSPLKK